MDEPGKQCHGFAPIYILRRREIIPRATSFRSLRPSARALNDLFSCSNCFAHDSERIAPARENRLNRHFPTATDRSGCLLRKRCETRR